MKKIIISFICILTVVVAIVSLLYPFPRKVAKAVGVYYGGPIINVVYCTCYYNPGTMITVLDKSAAGSPESFFYNPLTSLVRANYNIWKSGPQVLGSYVPTPISCQQTVPTVPPSCSPIGQTLGTIDSIIGIGSTAI